MRASCENRWGHYFPRRNCRFPGYLLWPSQRKLLGDDARSQLPNPWNLIEMAKPSFTTLDCDIFLYHSENLIADAIRLFDNSHVNHASIFLAPNQVGEALGGGIVKRSLSDSLAGSSWVEAMRLKTRPRMAPVRKVAERYLAAGDRYAYEQLVLLAFLCLSRRLAPNPFLRIMLRRVLDQAAMYLEKLATAATGDSREPMICSEFVYRSYDEALAAPSDLYTISISGATLPKRLGGIARGVHSESLLQWATLHDARLLTGNRSKRLRTVTRPESSARAMEDALRSYLEYTNKKSRQIVAPVVDDSELLRAVDRFAVQWARVRHKRESAKRRRLSSRIGLGVHALQPEGALATLWQVSADFVTPGNLEKSDSLIRVGAAK